MPAENAVKCVKCLHYIRQMSAHSGAGRGGAWGVVFDLFIFSLQCAVSVQKRQVQDWKGVRLRCQHRRTQPVGVPARKAQGGKGSGLPPSPSLCGWERMGKKKGGKKSSRQGSFTSYTQSYQSNLPKQNQTFPPPFSSSLGFFFSPCKSTNTGFI